MSSASPPPRSSPAPQAVTDLAVACVRYVKAALGFELDFERDTLPVLDGYLAIARRAVRSRPETLPLVAAAVGAYLGEVVRRLHACWWRTEGEDPAHWQLEFRDVYLSFRPIEMAHASLSLRPSGPDLEPGDEEEERAGSRAHEARDPSPGAGSPDLDEEELGPHTGASDDRTDDEAADEGDADESVRADDPFEPGLIIDESDRPTVSARLERLPAVTEEEYWAPSTRLEVIDIVVDCIQAKRLTDADRRRELGPADYED